jgi:hypothetical protein
MLQDKSAVKHVKFISSGIAFGAHVVDID